MAESAMSTFLSEIGTFFTQAVTWLGDVLDVITQNPALTVMVLAMPIVGFKNQRDLLKPCEFGGHLSETIPSQAS